MSGSEVPDEMAWLFPEVDLTELRLDEHSDFVLSRILDKGRLVDVQWALRETGEARIHDYLARKGLNDLSARAIAFWRAYFRAENEPWIPASDFRRNSSAPWPS